MEKMTFLESLMVSLNGIAVVFIVLIGLCLFVVIQTFLVKVLEKKAVKSTPVVVAAVNNITLPVCQIASGELKLVNVDEKTAAMVMAIVSDESKIPLSELIFKSIKALD